MRLIFNKNRFCCVVFPSRQLLVVKKLCRFPSHERYGSRTLMYLRGDLVCPFIHLNARLQLFFKASLIVYE